MTFPPNLKKNDTIGLSCPSGYMPAANTQTCIQTLQGWGYQVMVGKTVGSNSINYFSGTDEERRDEMQAMLDDDNIKAIICARGGYGMSRIIDGLDFKKFRKNPKWIIGFSDITVMHCQLYKKLKMSSIHGQMAAAYNDGGAATESIIAINKMLKGKLSSYSVGGNPLNRKGKAAGKLVGGNLSLMVNMLGTPSAINTDSCILFLEDIGEQLYNIDRMLVQLKRGGKLKNIAGMIFGGFTDMKDTERPFGKTIEEILQDAVAEYDYPVTYHFPIGHTADNLPVKIGADYQLNVGEKVTLKEVRK